MWGTLGFSVHLLLFCLILSVSSLCFSGVGSYFPIKKMVAVVTSHENDADIHVDENVLASWFSLRGLSCCSFLKL